VNDRRGLLPGASAARHRHGDEGVAVGEPSTAGGAGEPLAVEGGRPVRDSLLPYGRHALDEQDVQAVVAALSSGWLTTGPAVPAFERAVADVVGARHGVAVSSGTAALHAAAFAAGVGPGDEVIVPALTFAASANAACYLGATPVFADVSADTLNADPDDVAARCTGRTRAIVAVDFAGQPAELDALAALARSRGVALIEDAAHALGAELRGRPVGSIADLTTFSFHPVKHLTTGEGGLIATDSDESARRLRRFRNHGLETEFRERDARGDEYSPMVDLGYNYRITDLQCALGLSQLGQLDARLQRRAEIARRYRVALGALPGVALPAVAPDVRHAWHIFPVLLELDRLVADRRTVLAALRAENVGAAVHYVPVYWHPYYQARGYARGLCPRAERAFERLVTLPLFPAMTDRDVDDVVAAMAKVLGRYLR
jgi:perosamine synthetase